MVPPVNRCQHGAAYLGDGKGRTPLFFEDIQTYAALAVDIGMVYLSKSVQSVSQFNQSEGRLQQLDNSLPLSGTGLWEA